MHFSVKCDDLFNPRIGPSIDEILAAAEVPEPIATYARESDALFAAICNGWPKPAPDPTHAEPVTSAIPTLLSSGSFDPVTPPAYAEIAAATLSNAQQVVFASSGHGSITESNCAQGILVGFIADPQASPQFDCADDIGLTFVTTEEEFLEALNPGDLVVRHPFASRRTSSPMHSMISPHESSPW